MLEEWSREKRETVPSSCTDRFHCEDRTAKNRDIVLVGYVPLHWPVPLRCKRRREASPPVKGVLVTNGFELSSRILWDKIICDLNKTPDLSQRPPQNCLKCGNPVDGQYCQGCALLRKKFKEDLFTYCIKNGILPNSPEPSNDNTNVVNALQDPFLVKQDPGKNSSRSPSQINHHCCYGCGNLLEGIFCHQCTCELCGKGAHYGYNCPPKVLILLNPEPFNNQTIDELP
nr:hypothetical protein [Tanacetum cinerariifolium]